jgi:hypothetical protein
MRGGLNNSSVALRVFASVVALCAGVGALLVAILLVRGVLA